MTTKPLKTPKPLIAGDFSIRVDGAWLLIEGGLSAINLKEDFAWKTFLLQCRAGRFVEMLRGKIVVAHSR